MHLGGEVHPAASKAVLAKPLHLQKSAASLPSDTERWGWNGKGESVGADVGYSCNNLY